MIKLTGDPPSPQAKHLQKFLEGETEKEGVLSAWKGHNPT